MSLINDYLKKTQVEAPPQDKIGDVPPALKSSAKTRNLASTFRVAAVVAVVLIAAMVYLAVQSTTKKMTIPPDLVGQPPHLDVEELSPASRPLEVKPVAPVTKGPEKAVLASVPTAPAEEQPRKEPAPTAGKKKDTTTPALSALPAMAGSSEPPVPDQEYPPVKVRVAPIAPPVVARAVEVDQDHYYQLGLLAQKQGDYREAEKQYRAILADNPAHLQALINLAAVYILQNNYPQARTTLDRILRLDPHNTKALVNLGIISLKTGDPDSAERKFQEALRIDPGEETALTNLAYLAKQQSNTAQLEGYYARLLSITPENLEILFAYASLLEQHSRFAEAGDLYTKSLDLDAVKANRPLMQQIVDRIAVLKAYAQGQ